MEILMANDRLGAIQNRREQAKGGFDGFWYLNQETIDRTKIKQWVPEEGANFIAIIPPNDPNVYWAQELHIHYEIGVNSSAFICPRQHKEKCPICDERDKLKESGASADDIAPLNWTRRFLYFLADVKNDKTIDLGVQFAFLAKTIDEGILSLAHDDRTGADTDISDPTTGRTVIFTRKGSGKNGTSYIGFKDETRPCALPKEWTDNVPDFDSIVVVYSYETIYEELHGMSVAESVTTQPPSAEQTPAPETATQSEQPTSSSGVDALKARLRNRQETIKKD